MIVTLWENLASCALLVQNRQERMFIQRSSATIRNLPKVQSQETVDPKALNLAPSETAGNRNPSLIWVLEPPSQDSTRYEEKKLGSFSTCWTAQCAYQDEAQTTLSWEQVLETTDVPTTKSHQRKKSKKVTYIIKTKESKSFTDNSTNPGPAQTVCLQTSTLCYSFLLALELL